MITQELIGYIRGELARGMSRESITTTLENQGWLDADITEAFTQIMQSVASPVAVEPAVIASPVFISNAENVTVNSSPRKKFFLFGSIVLVILLGCGGYLYALGYFVTPSVLLTEALKDGQKDQKVVFDMTMDVDMSGFKIPKDEAAPTDMFGTSLHIKNHSAIDGTDEKNMKAAMSFSFDAGTVHASFESRILGDSVYLMLAKAPNLGFFSLTPFENKWITVPEKPDPAVLPSMLPTTALATSPFSHLTDEQKAHIKDMTMHAHLFTITKRHVPAIIDGALSYHFEATIDKEGFASYVKELFAYAHTIDPSLSSDTLPTDTQIDTAFTAVSSLSVESWIGMFDHRTHKIVLNGTFIDPEKKIEGSIGVTSTMLYTNWGKDVVVEKPAQSMTPEELFAQVFGGMMGGTDTSMKAEQSSAVTLAAPGGDLVSARLKGLDAQIQSTLSNMRAHAELYFDGNKNSYKGFCSAKGQSGGNTLARTLPVDTNYKCSDTATDWIAYAQLRKNTQSYACSDSTGVSTVIQGIPSGRTCKK